MPHYYFHIVAHGKMVRDEEGMTCANMEAAKTEAKDSAFDIAREAKANGYPVDGSCVEIQDEEGRILGSLTVAEVLDHPRHPDFGAICNQKPDIVH
jgi:hypothetical protein